MEYKSSRADYLTGIDGLRAISILAVMLYYINGGTFLQGGFTGVDVFFVISGYVISKSLYEKPTLSFPGYLAEFYKKRILRIIPALVVCLIVTITVSAMFIPAGWLSSTNSPIGLAAFFGYSNYELISSTSGYFSPRAEYNPFLHTWALGVGAQFYLVFPLLFYIWLRFAKNKSVIGYLSRGLLVGLAVLSFVYAHSQTSSSPMQAFYLLPSRFWELAAGALLFQLHTSNLGLCRSRRMSTVVLAPGIVLLAIGFVYASQYDFPYPWAMVPVAGAVLAISGITHTSGSPSVIHRLLQSPVVTFIGKLSYSLYLWSWPVVVLLRWTIGFDQLGHVVIYLVVTFVLAAASYRFIESPIRANAYLLRLKNWKLIPAGLVVVFVSYSLANYIDQAQSRISLSVTKDSQTWYPYGYVAPIPSDSQYADLAGRKLFVIGDSHTAAYRMMLKEVSSELGIEVLTYERGGCGVANLYKPVSMSYGCQPFFDRTFAEIHTLAQPDDIIFLASLRLPNLADQFEPFDEATVMPRVEREMAPENIQTALDDAIQQIDQLNIPGIHILIDAPKPEFKAPPYRCSDWFNKMNPICAPGLSVDRAYLLALRQPVMDSLAALESRYPNLTVWDPFPVLCTSEVCSAFDGDKPLIFDGDHLTGHANRVLEPSFKNQLLSIWGKS
jgi:peptidoglycan/LPS O-acetylase OafA/YrhL